MLKMKIHDERTLKNKFSGRGLVELFSQVTVQIEAMSRVRCDRFDNGLPEDTEAWEHHEELIHYKWRIAKIMADKIDGQA